MKRPQSANSLEEFGRARLSKSFFMRDFLYSEISNWYEIQNIPDNPDLAIQACSMLCTDLLEPLNETFGRISIFSGYRSTSVNRKGNEKGIRCASNEANYAGHIFDHLDENGLMGATASIAIPWFADKYQEGADWRGLAWWIHDNLPYSYLEFYPKLAAFNIAWHEKPKKEIHSYISPKGCLTKPGKKNHSEDHSEWYKEYPKLNNP